MGEEEQVAAEPQGTSEDVTPENPADEVLGTGVEPTPDAEDPTPTTGEVPAEPQA